MKKLFKGITNIILGIVLGTIIATVVSAQSSDNPIAFLDASSLETASISASETHVFLPPQDEVLEEDSSETITSHESDEPEEQPASDVISENDSSSEVSPADAIESEEELMALSEQAFNDNDFVTAYVAVKKSADDFQNRFALNLLSYYKGLAMNQLKDELVLSLQNEDYASAYGITTKIDQWDTDNILYFDHLLSLFELLAVSVDISEHIEKNPAYNISGIQADLYALAGGNIGLQTIELDCKYALSQIDDIENNLLAIMENYESVVDNFHIQGYDTTLGSPVYGASNVIWMKEVMSEVRNATKAFDYGIDAVQRYEKLVKKEEDGKLKTREFDELNALEPEVQMFLNSLGRQGTVPMGLSTGLSSAQNQLEYYISDDFISRQFQYEDNRIAYNLPPELLREKIVGATGTFLGASSDSLNALGEPVSTESYDIHSLFLETVQYGYWINDNYFNIDVHDMDNVVNAISFDTESGVIEFPEGDDFRRMIKTYGYPSFTGYVDIFRGNGTGYEWWVNEYYYENTGLTLTFISDDYNTEINYIILYNVDYNRDGTKRR